MTKLALSVHDHVVELANAHVSFGSPVLACLNSSTCRLRLPLLRRLNTWINSLNRRATLAILRVNRTELVFSRPLFHR